MSDVGHHPTIRRRLVNDGAELDSGVQATLEKIGKTGNSFGQARAIAPNGRPVSISRSKMRAKSRPSSLWFVGDTASVRRARAGDHAHGGAVLKAGRRRLWHLYDAEKKFRQRRAARRRRRLVRASWPSRT